jgi:hypothetical protein
MKLKIEITETDISRGIRESSNKCPIGKALRRVGCKEVYVDLGVILFTKNGKKYESDSTIRLDNFLERFDTKKKVRPGVFEIQCDEYYL